MKWHAKISPDLVIVAVCARPYVTAAVQAGYRVAAFDAFQDTETLRLAMHGVRVPYANGGFAARPLLEALGSLDMSRATVVLGSGLERDLELLEMIFHRFRVAGNHPQTVSLVKQPERFFPLLDALGIAHPETRLHPPPQREGWLSKRTGGSGGTHVRYCDDTPADYYQRVAPGRPVSVLFLADGARAVVVGFNAQWPTPAPDMPFRFGGIVGNADLPLRAKAVMTEAVERVTAVAGLRGLNSMDFMLDGTQPLALEINPRLSASFTLYDAPRLMQAHLNASKGLLEQPWKNEEKACALQVVYANVGFTVHEKVEWPPWVTDMPLPGTWISPGDPVCTVHAHASSADAAKALVFARARRIEAQLSK